MNNTTTQNKKRNPVAGMMKLSALKYNPKNPRRITDEDFDRLKKSVEKFPKMFTLRPIIYDPATMYVLGGNQRLKALRELGFKEIPETWVKSADELTEDEKREFVLRDNVQAGDWDIEILKSEWDDFDLEGFGIEFSDTEDKPEAKEDDYQIPDEIKTDIVFGDLFEIGRHRLLCGDSTKTDDVAKLMNGEKADMAHNDPPYGMKKENEGVLNDNLNYNDLLQFNREWISIQFSHLKENGSFYCWGTDEPLMDIYSHILKPYIKTQKATFRNLITWNKTHPNTTYRVNGFQSPDLRSYYASDEKCLFVMCGVQGFNNNSDNYFDGWEPIRKYLCDELKKTGLTVKELKPYIGDMFGHYFTKSQWMLPTKEKYEALKKAAKDEAFKKDYEAIKAEYYTTRSYFDNMHDKMKDTWTFEITSTDERKGTGDHATPKPIKLCERVIKSSCPENGLVIDMFLGSGSTMVAAHQLNRKCYGMEIEPKYVAVILRRMKKLDQSLEIKCLNRTFDIEKELSE